ncbi:hypothetical protein M501DRAFT_1000276, partial [Patellaria atrata CBS 101060]
GNVEVWVLWWICQLSVSRQPRSSMEHKKKSLFNNYLFRPQLTPLSQQISQRLLDILRFGYVFSVALEYI